MRSSSKILERTRSGRFHVPRCADVIGHSQFFFQALSLSSSSLSHVVQLNLNHASWIVCAWGLGAQGLTQAQGRSGMITPFFLCAVSALTWTVGGRTRLFQKLRRMVRAIRLWRPCRLTVGCLAPVALPQARRQLHLITSQASLRQIALLAVCIRRSHPASQPRRRAGPRGSCVLVPHQLYLRRTPGPCQTSRPRHRARPSSPCTCALV